MDRVTRRPRLVFDMQREFHPASEVRELTVRSHGELFGTLPSDVVAFDASNPTSQCAAAQRHLWLEWCGDEAGQAGHWVFWRGASVMRHRVAVISSHLGRHPDLHGLWWDHLAEWLRQRDPTSDALLTCPTTTCDRFLRAIASDYQLPLTLVVTSNSYASVSKWWEALHLPCDRAVTEPTGGVASLSPAVYGGSVTIARHAVDHLAADRALFELADAIYVWYVRPRGRLDRLLSQWIEERPDMIARCHFREAVAAISTSLLDRVTARGGKLWSSSSSRELMVSPSRAFEAGARSSTIGFTTQEVRAMPRDEPREDATQWLVHWTRATTGPWPDQSWEDYVRDLLRGPVSRDRSALATLARIVASRRIKASSRWTRTDTPVVCFTETSWRELPQRRVYRRHLGRWDFESYGLAIDRHWLAARGAQPVIYGDEVTWRTIEPHNRFRFQLQRTQRGTHDRSIDWTCEREWRIAADVDLSEVPSDHAFVFVPDDVDDDFLSHIVSPWPVVRCRPSKAAAFGMCDRVYHDADGLH